MAFCSAYDGNLYRACTTSDPVVLYAIRAVKDDSYLTFYWTRTGIAALSTL